MNPYEQIGQGIGMIDLALMIFIISRAIGNYVNSKRLGDNERARNSYKGCLKGCLGVVVFNIVIIVLLALFF
jgi:hypothetical protein